ncbi:GIY-YIG nuclease family protein [Gangjinia marincola]|uniref:GIY-YIG nuclease family protein n=1 Tax=Gangjinia marincola TaxID=578463 RepID=A0ABN1MIE4_9FLAO
MKFYYVYILLCSDGSYYTGMTSDLEKRIQQHLEGKTYDNYTRSRRPIHLKWFLQCSTPDEAIRMEKKIKGWSRSKKEALIEENWDDLVKFSKNYTQFGKPD